MISKVAICNMALSHVGATTITAIDEDSNEAIKCNLFWDMALDATLRSHDWTFAEQNQILAEIADELVTGYDFLYAVPSSCLFVRKVYCETTDFTKKRTEDFSQCLSPDTSVQAIATNVEDAYISFTVRVTNVSLWDACFVDAFTYRLAGLIAKPLTGDLSLAQAMHAMAEAKLNVARGMNKSGIKEDLKRYSATAAARGG